MERLDTNEHLRGIVMNLPASPGIYQYLDKDGTIIYVGKAKNLKRRVYSYFSKEHDSAKTRILVSKITDIRYIVVNTEEDALLLENNLIKKFPLYVLVTNITHVCLKRATSFATGLRTMVRIAISPVCRHY